MKCLLVLFGVFGLDLGTKKWAEASLPLGKRKKIGKKQLYFQHIKNFGMAYHKLEGKKNSILCITGGLTAIYSCLFLRASLGDANDKRYALPLAVILGGAYGNFLERAKKGYVTDFILIKKGKNPPIFNIADAALLIGTVFIGIVSLKKPSNL